MKKSDLKSGMVIEWKEGYKFLIVGQSAIGRNGKHSLSTYTEDLKDNLGSVSYDIVKVYTTNNENINLNNIFDENYLDLIWEREREIDWSKVPEWTKVQVKFPGEIEWENYLFTNYLPNNVFKFHVAGFKDDEFTGYEATRHQAEYCKIHPSVKIKEEWYK